MKKLTDSQRKWALTACLASVLSFNMVLSLSRSNIGMASFASTQPRYETVKLNGKEVEVKIIDREDGRMEATVPEKLESGWCYQCAEPILLPKNVTSLAAALKDAQKAEAAQEKSEGEDLDAKPAKKVAKKEKTVQLDEEEQQEEEQENPDFAALRERCDKKDDEQTKLRCYAGGLTKLLKNKKKTYAREDVLELYRSEIEPTLRASLMDISDLVPKRRSWGRHQLDFDLGDESENTRRQDAQSLIEDMTAQITSKYNFLRERLTKLAANSVLKTQENAQMKLKQADQIKNTDPQNALRLQQEGMAGIRAANQVANDFGGSLYDSLESAQWSNHITSSQFDSMYYTNYADVVNQAIRGLAQNPLSYVLPNVTLSDGTTIVDQNGQSYTVTATGSSVVQSNGRNITVMMNNLTPANVANSSTPRIAVNAVPQAGSATIQVMQGVAAPVNQTNVPTFRARGQ